METMDRTILFFLRLTLIVLVAIVLFFLSGFTYVQKNRFVFASKGKALKGIWDEGWHYSLPWKYHLSPSYPKGPFSIAISQEGRKVLTAYLMIRDPEKLFALKGSIRSILKREVRKAKDNTEIRKRVEAAYKKGGIELINLVVTKKG